MRIVVIGLGNVGGALTRLWVAAGHQVSAAARDSHRHEHPDIAFGGPAEIAYAAEVVVVCVPGLATEEALKPYGDLGGKIIIDCTNPVLPKLEGLAYGGTTSTAEKIQASHPGASVIKAFNTMGAALLGNAVFNGQPADGFFCGDNVDSKRSAHMLINDAQLRPVDVGPLRSARYLEALAMLWIDMAVNGKRGPSFVFNLIERQ